MEVNERGADGCGGWGAIRGKHELRDSYYMFMSNPWLHIPLSDYESHMRDPNVAQLDALAGLFEQSLTVCRPDSLAILGIAGGNGLDRVDPGLTQRIVGVDIHPGYLESVRQRYPELPLKLVCMDLQREVLKEPPVQLVHAALIFEHAGTEQCLRNAASLVRGDGFLSVVLQLPTSGQPAVSQTSVSSMQGLSEHFRFVDQGHLVASVGALGFSLVYEMRHEIPGGKALWLGIFDRT